MTWEKLVKSVNIDLSQLQKQFHEKSDGQVFLEMTVQCITTFYFDAGSS